MKVIVVVVSFILAAVYIAAKSLSCIADLESENHWEGHHE